MARQETEACRKYGDDVVRLVRFIHYTFQLILPANAKPSGITVDEYLAVYSELLHCRAVDSFLHYVSALLAEIYKARPEALRSSEKVETEFVLQFSTMQEFVNALADKRVHELSYRGLEDLAAFLNNTMSFPLFPDDIAKKRAILAVEIRNLHAHNRGIVNARFKSRVPDHPSQIGLPLAMPPTRYFDLLEFLLHAAMDIDKRAVEKFGLSTVERVPRWGMDDLLTLGEEGWRPQI